MTCSPTILSLSTIFAIVSCVLLAIAFSSDNWINYEVKRANIMVKCGHILGYSNIY